MANKQTGPVLPDLQTISQMVPEDINNFFPYKSAIQKQLRINDEQLALGRYEWYNLPSGLTGELIERILFYRGTAMFFYIPERDVFRILPYCLDGEIDEYGRFLNVKPLPFLGKDTLETPAGKRQSLLLSMMNREPVYDTLTVFNAEEAYNNKCVLLYDYCKQLSQSILPRQKINEGIIDIESDIIPMARTALQNSSGIAGVRVNDPTESTAVSQLSSMVRAAALNGEKYIATVGSLDFQNFDVSSVRNAQDYLLFMQSLDNFRLGSYGLDNGGLFEKKAHMLNAEAAMNQGTTGIVLQDGLKLRQEACYIINFIFGLSVWCEISETAAGADLNMDGLIGNNQQQMPEMETDSGDEGAEYGD